MRIPVPLCVTSLCLSLLVACSADERPARPQPGGDCTLIVVSSDYVSTSISLLSEDGSLCRDNVLHSGSAPPGLVTALSGDVVPAANLHPDGRIVLLDRYPNAVLTFLDPDDFRPVGQIALGTGFAANPYDVLFVGPGRAYVTRHDTNPSPGREAFDGGGDVRVVDTDRLAIAGRIDMHPLVPSTAPPMTEPRPDRLVRVGDRVFAILDNLSRDFQTGAAAGVVEVAPATDTVVAHVAMGALENCRCVAPTSDGLWLGCNGVFGEGADRQLAASGVAFVSTDAGGLTVTLSRSAQALGTGPVGESCVALGTDRLLASIFGDLNGAPDRFVVIDRSGRLTDPGLQTAAFGFGRPALVGEVLLIPDAHPAMPAIRRLRVRSDGGFDALSPVDANPAVGLPPRSVARFRELPSH